MAKFQPVFIVSDVWNLEVITGLLAILSRSQNTAK